MRRRDLLAGAGALAVAGCVAPNTVPPDAMARARRIALIPAFDPELTLRYTGFTVFENQENTFRTDWDLDGAALRLARDALAGRHEVLTPALDRRAIYQSQQVKFGHPDIELTKVMATLMPPGQADLIMVIGSSPVHGRDGTGGRIRDYHYGMRLQTWGSLRFPDHADMILPYRVALLDGTSFALLAAHGPTQQTARGYATPLSGPTETYTTLPMTRLFFRFRGEAWDTLPPDRQVQVKQGAFDALAGTLPGALRQLGFAGTGSA